MTTIAWDGKRLAADKQSTQPCGKVRRTKVYRLNDGSLYGAAGLSTTCDALREWLDAGAAGERPKVFDDEEDAPDAIVVKPTGDVWIYSKHGRYKPEAPFIAIGSGSQFAMAAMYLGQSAPEAVMVASALDAHTGMGVDVLWLGDEG